MFSGSGGFDLAVELTNACRVVWANDNDAAAVETYRQNFDSPIVPGDVRRIDVPKVPCDILIGGPPCQDYSVLWLHEGVRTSRGALYMEFVRFLAELQPKAFILENVKGLLSANAGEAWALVRSALKGSSLFRVGDDVELADGEVDHRDVVACRAVAAGAALGRLHE